jgi:thioredoxin reductase (NADPH)
MQHEKVIIIGSGPAGLTAALYAARANLDPVVIAGDQLGGQVAITNEVENYPGFPDGLLGPDLVDRFRKQAERFGARIVHDRVTEVDFTSGRPFYVKTYGTEYKADAVIVAVGATPRHLNVPGEIEFTGRGVSYCGTCDGFFFKDKEVVVAGGGDSAIEEGLFLTKFATRSK